MSNNIIKSAGGVLWLEVTEKAEALLKAGVFDLYVVTILENGDTRRLPVLDESDLDFAERNNGKICIEIGRYEAEKSLGHVTLDSWDNADKIQHNGYIYVRYNDLSFCK